MAMSEGLSKVDKFVYVVDIVIKDKYGRFSGNANYVCDNESTADEVAKVEAKSYIGLLHYEFGQDYHTKDLIIKTDNDGHIYNIKLYDKNDPTITRLDINITKAAVLTSTEDYFDFYLDND